MCRGSKLTNNDMTYDSHVMRSWFFETVANLYASHIKQIMATKEFQTRTEEEIEQLLHDKSSKYINKLFNEVLAFVI